MAEISATDVLAKFDYDREGGSLRYKHRQLSECGSRRSWAGWQERWAGRAAGCLNKSGYLHCNMLGHTVAIHTLIWLVETGHYPTAQIDHINHNKTDNRFCNLRLVTASENRRNQKDRLAVISGVMGVYWSDRDALWYPRVKILGKMIGLGATKDFFEAVCRRKSAELAHGFHENHARAA